MMATRDELAELSDSDLVAEAERRRTVLVALPSDHPDRDDYIAAWRKAVDEIDERTRAARR